jgi:hypothetical protein
MKRLLVLLFLVCLSILHVGAQSTAQIVGTIQDSSGAAVAGAQVQITNVDTNAVRTAQSSDIGAYIFPNLEIGPYRLEVSKAGFATYSQFGIVLQVNSNPEINVTLQVGAVTQTVEVTANAAMVETQSTGVGQVIQPEQVIDLPLNGREATQLIALSGAAVVSNMASNLEYPNAPSFSIAGSQGNATNYYLDGSLNMDYRTNAGEVMPFPDALQEFKVESSALPANLGVRPGGTVNGSVKSGTNSFHGDAFDFLRNTVMDADPERFTQNNGKPSIAPIVGDNLKRNQFGGTIGGPVIKNKAFFFYGYQGTRDRVLGLATTAQVPTAATLAGNFTAMLAPPCQKTQVFLAAQYVTAPNSNILKPGSYGTVANGGNPSSAVAANLSTYLPTPVDACGTASYSAKTVDDENQSVMRFDWQRNQNDSIFARYFITNYTLLPYYANHNILTSSNTGYADRVQTVDLGDTHIFNPQLISSLRVAFLRSATIRALANGIPTWTQLGSNQTTQYANFIRGSITNYFTPTNGAPSYNYENTFEISESLGWTLGAHQLSFGFAGEHVQMNCDGLFQVNGTLTFSGSVTGNALADFITGNPSSLSQGNGQLGRDSQNMPALYFQDYWKVTRRFQVNLGLRWDPFIPQYTKYKQASDFSLAGYEAGAISSVYPNAPPGVTFPGDTGFSGKSDTIAHLWDFGPRVGIVWDPRGDGRETIRAGYGMFYDTSVLWNTMHVVLNPPWGLTITTTPPTALAGGGAANPWFQYLGGNPFPSPLNPPSSFAFPQHGTYVFENEDIKPNNVQQWNLSFQKQLGSNWLVSASYIGSKTTHQWLGQNVDPSVVITSGTIAPGIVSDAGVTSTTGSCTLLYGGTAVANQVTFNPCNGSGTTSLSAKTGGGVSVTNYNARRALNLINPTAGPLMDGGNIEDFSNGNASYNGLLVSAQHRLSQNFSVLGNFTWSHCMDQGEIGQDIGNQFQNPANRQGEWGNCASDRRRIFNLSLVVQSPRHGSRVLQAILGNWRGSGIFTASSGSWLNVTDGEDASLTGIGADRPIEVGSSFIAGTVAANSTCVAPSVVHTLAAWFNPCAFEMAPLGTFGTLGRGALQGPGNWNFDTAIWRTFPLSERFKLDFRAEGFNVFNHFEEGNPGAALFSGNINLASPNATTRNANAGYISSSNPQRILQVAMKLTF